MHGEHKIRKKSKTSNMPAVLLSTPATMRPKLKPQVKQKELAASTTAAAGVVCGARLVIVDIFHTLFFHSINTSPSSSC